LMSMLMLMLLEYTDGKYADGKCVDGKYADGKYADGKYADGKCADGKYADGKYADGKYADGKCADDDADDDGPKQGRSNPERDRCGAGAITDETEADLKRSRSLRLGFELVWDHFCSASASFGIELGSIIFFWPWLWLALGFFRARIGAAWERHGFYSGSVGGAKKIV